MARLRLDRWHERWIVLRGRETFYDEDRYLRTWATAAAAADWCEANLGERPNQPDEPDPGDANEPQPHLPDL